jgi:sugar phosphate isomerase/epimerase
MNKPIALQLYSVRDAAAQDFFGVLRQVADMGYAGVEYAGLHGRAPAEVARVVADLGLSSASSHVPLPTAQNIEQIAADARALGCRHIVSGFAAQEMQSEDGCRALADRLATACELAESAGLSLALHNHWWEFDHDFNGRTPFDIIMTGAPRLHSELDIYWCTKAGRDTPATVRQYARRIPLLHIKDGDLGPEHMHTAVGDGRLPIRQIIHAADPGILQWLIVELDNCATDMMEAVARSVVWIKRNIT